MRQVLRITSLILLSSVALNMEALALEHYTSDIITANTAQSNTLASNGSSPADSDSVKQGAKLVAKMHLKKELSKISWKSHTHISKVIIIGNKSVSSEKIQKVIDPYLKNGIARNEARDVIDGIEDQYINAGYYLPVAHLHIEGTTLKIEIVEGKIRDVLVSFDDVNRDKKALDNKLFLQYLKKIEQANPIRTRDLEKYLLFIDNIPGYNVECEFLPLKDIKENKVGDLLMKISTKKATAGIAIDNASTQSLGVNQINLAATVFNPISNDAFILNAGTTNRPERIRLITGAYEKRLNAYGTSASVFGSYLESNPNKSLVGSKYNTSGVLKGQVDQYLIYNNDYSVKLEISSEKRNVTNYVANGIKFNQYHYPIGSVGGAIKITDPLNTDNWFYPHYKWTLNKVHFTSDSFQNFDKKFSLFRLDWYRDQSLPNNFSFLLMASYQATNKNLPLEWIYSINSGNTARGYATGLVAADQGITGIAELRYSYQFTSEEAKKFVKSVQPFIFYDITRFIKHNSPSNPSRHPVMTVFDKSNLSATGFGAKLFLTHGYYGEATAQFPLLRHITINGTRQTNKTLYRFNISKEFNW